MASQMQVRSVGGMLRGVFSHLVGEMEGRRGDARFCCMLHHFVSVGETNGGCDVVPDGYHRAIKALINHNSHVCVTEVGQRVLDARVVAIAFGEFRPYELDLGFRKSAFKKRYFRGFHVFPAAYGKGYCYLWLFPGGARSRIARILGQFPLFIDVLRLWMVLGDWDGGQPLELKSVGNQLYHVGFAQTGVSAVQVVLEMCQLLLQHENLRIGGDVGDRCYTTGECSGGIFSGLSTVIVRATVEGDRIERVDDYFRQLGIHLPGDCLLDLMLVTRAAALCGVGETVAKSRAKMLAVLGDHVIKLVTSFTCVAALKTSEEFTRYDAQAKNVELASKFVLSGFRDVCDVTGLAVESKANASILEAVVGSLSLHVSFADIVSFLVHIGFRFPDVLDRDVFETTKLTGLTSEQYSAAMQLVAAGKL